MIEGLKLYPTHKDSLSASEGQVLRACLSFGRRQALRGEFSLTSGLALQPASVPCEPKLEGTTHSKR